MIPKVAVKKFLARPRDDLRLYKKFSDAKLEALIKKRPFVPVVWHKFRKHQKVCFLIGTKLNRCAFYCDTGMGKTFLSIGLVKYFRELGKANQFLVVAPYNVNRWEWAREIKKHSPESTYKVLTGTSKEKLHTANTTEATFVITTFAGLVRMCCTLQPAKKGKKKNRLKIDKHKIKLLFGKYSGVILDQSEHVGNQRSLQFKVIKRLSDNVKYLYELSGTPFGRDPTPLHSQIKLVDGGYSLGETLGLFRSAFFSTRVNYWGGYEHHFLKRTKKELHRILAHRSIYYEVDQGDLPRVVEVPKLITLPHEARQYYDKAREMAMKARGNYREMKNSFMRMRQISSGFLGYYDDDLGEKAKVNFDPNPKLDMLLSIIETISPQYKAIVFIDFIWSADRIQKELQEREIGHLRISGGKYSKDTDKTLHAFDNDPKKQVLILSNVMAVGLNLQKARYGIYYEAPVSPRVRKESRRRFERQESPHSHVFLYDLICRGTYDQRILDLHKEGRDLWQAILKGQEPV